MKKVFTAAAVLLAVAAGAVRPHPSVRTTRLYGGPFRGWYTRGARHRLPAALCRARHAIRPRGKRLGEQGGCAGRWRCTAQDCAHCPFPPHFQLRWNPVLTLAALPPWSQDARKLLQGPATQQSVEQMAAIGQAEHWAPWQPGTPWGTTKVVNGVVVQTSEEAAAQESADAATMTPDQQQKVCLSLR